VSGAVIGGFTPLFATSLALWSGGQKLASLHLHDRRGAGLLKPLATTCFDLSTLS
jgi:hypothetical protein